MKGQADARGAALRLAAAGASVLASILTLAACSQTAATGDLGRPRHGVVQDRIGPAIGQQLASHRGEPVSHLSLSLDELELRSRAVVLTRPADERDLVAVSMTEAERIRLGAPGITLPRALNPGPVRGASSEARWAELRQEITTDSALMPAFFQLAGRVAEADRARWAAAATVTPAVAAEVAGRLGENGEVIGRVKSASLARLTAFGMMADRLDAEAPSVQAAQTRQALADLAGLIGPVGYQPVPPVRGILQQPLPAPPVPTQPAGPLVLIPPPAP